MSNNYPDDYIHTGIVYSGISNQLQRSYISDPNSWENSCAIRMSKALNLSGVKLPSSDVKYRSSGADNGVLKGMDGNYYWFRVKPLGKYLKEILKSLILKSH